MIILTSVPGNTKLLFRYLTVFELKNSARFFARGLGNSERLILQVWSVKTVNKKIIFIMVFFHLAFCY